MKQSFRTRADENPTGIRRNLHLEDGVPRVKSEVHMYMSLYYSERIRPTVQSRWEKERIPCLESNITSTIPESDLEPDEIPVFSDMKIPISFKNIVAKDLYEKETEEIKARVRSLRNAGADQNTVYTTEGRERMELLEEYQKYVRTLSRSYL